MSLQCEGKSSWPELVGSSGESAAEIIERENTTVNAILVPKGSFVTADIRGVNNTRKYSASLYPPSRLYPK
ncbi:hypothetical protein C5167_019515 [Papaver somniferum]|uniref:Uncharacterized protein n=1 Tax=Papaver somniferum TaxID=3469 RepID=A0A4Y7IUD1_PAPSO|nr:hypothetical protein C5167_019515 [Papaver somniferum]